MFEATKIDKEIFYLMLCISVICLSICCRCFLVKTFAWSCGIVCSYSFGEQVVANVTDSMLLGKVKAFVVVLSYSLFGKVIRISLEKI